jgi:regulatory protein
MAEGSDLESCYAAAMRVLQLRWNSVAELRRKLARKKFTAAHIDDTVERLRREKWLDDERFATALVRTRSRRFGRNRIARELGAAGVERETAQRAITENVDPETEQAAIVALCEKKSRMIARRHGTAYLASELGRKKVAAYLLNHGYGIDAVLRAIATAVAGIGEDGIEDGELRIED